MSGKKAPAGLDDPVHAAAVAKFAAIDAQRGEDSRSAIAILERRALTLTREIELPGGHTIPIRIRHPKTEEAEINRLRTEISEGVSAGDTAHADAAATALLGHILYLDGIAPDEIAAWLAANPDKFSDPDASEIFLQYRKALKEDRQRRAALIESFRDE